MTASRWSVLEFDADLQLIATSPDGEEGVARRLFDFVTLERSQRSDVVQRARSAALMCGGTLVEARSIAVTRRAPWVGSERLRHLDPETRDRVHRIDRLAAHLALAALRLDGRPRRDAVWARVRSVACELWDTVCGPSASRSAEDGWWLVEWTCGDHQSDQARTALHERCPYHDAGVRHGPVLVDR